jgi:dihydrofolate reductase
VGNRFADDLTRVFAFDISGQWLAAETENWFSLNLGKKLIEVGGRTHHYAPLIPKGRVTRDRNRVPYNERILFSRASRLRRQARWGFAVVVVFALRNPPNKPTARERQSSV